MATHKTSYLIISILIVTLVVHWFILGASFYSKVVPFYDSVAFQNSFLKVQALAKSNGIVTAFKYVLFMPKNSALFFFLTAAFGSWLPSNITAFYAFYFGTYVLFIFSLFFLPGEKKSLIPAVLSIALFLSARVFSMAYSGVLDQRVDLSAACLLGITIVSAIRWLICRTKKDALLFGLAISLVTLHRPAFIAIVLLILLLYGCLFVRLQLQKSGQFRNAFTHLAIIALPIIVIAMPWFLAQFSYLKWYYFTWNYDVGGNYTLLYTAAANLRILVSYIGIKPFILLGLTTALGFLCADFRWKRFALVALTFCVIFLPLVITRSCQNRWVPLIGVPVLALLPWTFQNWGCKTIPKFIRIAVIAVALAFTLRNAVTLQQRVNALDQLEIRQQCIKLIHSIYEKNERKEIPIDTFLAWPLSIDAIQVLARQEGIPVRTGHYYYHAVEFGILNRKERTLSSDEIEVYLRKALKEIKGRDSFLVVTDLPGALFLSIDCPIWGNIQLPKIVQLISEMPEFKDMGINEKVGSINLKVYR